MEKFEIYLRESLQNQEEMIAYVNSALEQYFLDSDKELFLATLREVIIAKGGITKISKETDINRQHIYKMLSNKGNPSFNNIGLLLGALGLSLRVQGCNLS